MRNNSIFWGAILVLIGILFLLDNLNIINIPIWSIFWPLVLILVGARMIWRTYFRPRMTTEEGSVALDGAESARLHLRHGAGRLELRAGAASGNLVEGLFGGGVIIEQARSGGRLDVSLKPRERDPFNWEPGMSLDWTVLVSEAVTLELEVDSGASDTHLELSQLRISNLRIKTGASSTQVTLPANAGYTRAAIECGAASLKLRIPPGVAARIDSRGGLSSLSVDEGRFPRSHQGYASPDFDSALNRVEVVIQMGVGSVDIG